MKKIVITLLVLLGVANIAHSQIITITDSQSGKPLEMATLLSAFPDAFTTTNTEGQADISAFNGSEKIEIRVLGYKTKTDSFSEIESANFQIQLEETNINLDQVVVSATRWQQSSNDIPSKITSITAKEVAFQNPQTAADLLGISGKVIFKKASKVVEVL